MKSESQSVLELQQALGLNVINPNTCWLDGSACPYGLPNGKFEDRPLAFCRPIGSGCTKLTASNDLTAWLQPIFTQEIDEAQKEVKDEFHEKREPLSDFLKNQAEVLLEDGSINSVENKLILAAAKVFAHQAEEEGNEVFVFEVSDRA